MLARGVSQYQYLHSESIDMMMPKGATIPTTTIQIRYGDGTRKAQKFNEDHTVGDLYNFVSQVCS